MTARPLSRMTDAELAYAVHSLPEDELAAEIAADPRLTARILRVAIDLSGRAMALHERVNA